MGNTGQFLIVTLTAWLPAIIFVIWLFLSLREIKGLLRSILDELRRSESRPSY